MYVYVHQLRRKEKAWPVKVHIVLNMPILSRNNFIIIMHAGIILQRLCTHVIAELEHWLTPFSAQLMSEKMSNSSCQTCEKLIKILEEESQRMDFLKRRKDGWTS